MSGIRKHLRYVSFFMAMMMALGSVWSATATAGIVRPSRCVSAALRVLGQECVSQHRRPRLGGPVNPPQIGA